MAQINLLPEEEIKAVEAKKARQKVTTFSLVTLVGITLVTIVVIGYWLVLIQQDRQVTKKIETLSSQIQNLSNIESLARVLKNKLSAILTISAKSQNFENTLNNVSQIIPAGVTLSDLTVSDQNLITLTGKAISASEFSNLISALLAKDDPQAAFGNVTVESLTRDDKGIYQFAITAKLKSGKI